MFVDSEVFTGPCGMAVYKDRIQKRGSPYDNVPVTDSIRQTKSRPLSGCPMGHSEKTRLAVKEQGTLADRLIESALIAQLFD